MSVEQRAQNNQQITRHLHSYAFAQQVKWLGCYAAYRHEPDLSLLLEPSDGFALGDKTYGTALPKIMGSGAMAFYAFEKGDPSETNAYGILEPLASPSKLVACSEDPKMGLMPRDILIVVPALAVDQAGHRLGYGGGYYDRYLERYSGIQAIAVVFSEFVMECLPVESHDQKISGYVTEKGVRIFSTDLIKGN